MVILDTNIIIDHLRQRGSATTLLMEMAKRVPKANLAISLLTVQELYEGRSTRDSVKEDYLLATIAPLRILPYTFETAEFAGKIARDLLRPIEFVDAGIAATAIINKAELATLNTGDFQGIPDLEIYTV